MSKKEKINALKNDDIYATILFILYKLKDAKEYSTLSELIYILDKDNLLKLCEYYGGRTITIPTVDEIEKIVKMLLVYHYVNMENIDFENAIKMVDVKTDVDIVEEYNNICSILSKYNLPE